MKKITKLITAITASFFMTVSSAVAFEGFSIGVIATTTDFETTGSEIEGGVGISSTGQEINTGKATKSADYGSVFVEYTVPQGSTFGFSYIPGEAEIGAQSRTDAGAPVGDAGTYTAKAEISDHWTFYAEPTVMASEKFGVYGKIGVANVTVATKESITLGTDDSSYGDVDVWGVTYGLGVKGVHENGMFFKLEGTKTEYGTVTLTSTTGNQNTITADPEAESINLAIGYNF
jgi:hypothetical protein